MIEFAKLRYTSDDIRMIIGDDDQLKEEYIDIYKEWENNCVLSPIERKFIYNILMSCINRVDDKTISDTTLCIFKTHINSVMDELVQRLTHSLIFKDNTSIFDLPFYSKITTGCIHMFINILATDGYPYDYTTFLDLLIGMHADYIFRNKSNIYKLHDDISDKQKSDIAENISSLLSNIYFIRLMRYDIDETDLIKSIDDISRIDVSIVEAYDIGISHIVEIAVNYMAGEEEDREESINELRKILKLVADNRELFKSVIRLYSLLNIKNYYNPLIQ